MKKKIVWFLIICLTVLSLAIVYWASTEPHKKKPSETITLTFTTYIPFGSFHKPTVAYLDELERRSQGLVKVRVRTWGGALFGATELLKACGKGAVDIALSSPLYTPTEQPLWSFFNAPFLTSDVYAGAMAQTELYETWQPARDEIERNNVVLLYKHASSPMSLGLAKVINSPNDLAGLKIRAHGKLWGRSLENSGSIPVLISASEIVQAMNRGTIDGWSEVGIGMAPVFAEGTEQIIDPRIGPYGAAEMVMNKDVYEGLPESAKKLIKDMRSEWALRTARISQEMDEEAIEKIQELQIPYLRFTDEQFRKWHIKMDVEAELKEMVDDAEAKGVPAREGLRRFRALARKYEAQQCCISKRSYECCQSLEQGAEFRE